MREVYAMRKSSDLFPEDDRSCYVDAMTGRLDDLQGFSGQEFSWSQGPSVKRGTSSGYLAACYSSPSVGIDESGVREEEYGDVRVACTGLSAKEAVACREQ